MNNYLFLLPIVVLLCCSCGPQDDREAKAIAPNRQVYYDFFNDIRLEIAPLEEEHSRLEGFMEETKIFLESRETQGYYDLTGMYFERNLNREEGAYDYEDRFFDDGMVIHFIVYPPQEMFRYEGLLGVNKGYGKQVGQNFVYYQIFSAKPTDTELEEEIKSIVERNIEKHAQFIGNLQ